MARPRQPINLILLKGKKHLTKAEIEERRRTEVKAKADKVKPPSYLSPELKREFKKIANELMRIDLISNLDVDALARYLQSREMYLKVTDELMKRSPVKEILETIHDDDGKVLGVQSHEAVSDAYAELLLMQDKLFKQCRSAASDLGLTISSRCKLVIPKPPEEKPKSEEEQMFGDAL